MTVLFDPEGRVRLSFPGALRKKDFMDILMRVEAETKSGPMARVPAQRSVHALAPVPVRQRK
jgi:hypothetical protein